MCSRSLTHAQTIGAVALPCCRRKASAHDTNANTTNKTNKTGRDIPPGAYRQLQAAERTGLVKHEKPHRVGAEMRCRDQGLQPTRRAHHHVAPTTQTTRARGAPLAANRFRSPLCWRCRSRASTGIIPRPMGVPVARTARPAMRGRRVRVKSAAVAQPADYCGGWTTSWSSALVRALGSSQTHWPSKRAERRRMHEVVSGRSSLRHDEIKAALVAFICARMTSSAVPIVRYVE